MDRVTRLIQTVAAFALLIWHGHAFGQADINLPPRQDTKSGTGVSFKTGSFTLDGIVDLSIGGPGLAGLQLVRSYSSSLSPAFADNTNAQGWTYNIVATVARNRLTYSPDQEPPPDPLRVPLVYTVSTGLKSVSFLGGFSNVPPASYIPMSRGGETLAFSQVGSGLPGSGSSFTFIDSDGSVYVFPYGSQTRLANVTYPDDTRHDFTYTTAPTGNKVTKSIISNRGYAILFDGSAKACVVNMSDTYITATSTCPASAPSVNYTYTTSTFNTGVKNLTGAADALGHTTTYGYVGADHLGCVKEPGQSTCKITNTYDVCIPPPGPNPPPNLRYSDRVTSQTTGTVEVYTYSYEVFGAYEYCSDFSGYGAQTTLIAPGNAATLVSTNGAGLPTGVVDPLNRTTNFNYFGNFVISWEKSLLSSETQPEGNTQLVVRDERANIIEKRIKAKPGSGLADRVISASYPASCANRKTCNKPDYVIDARGARTDYTYDPNHGGVLTEMAPPDVNGVRPQKRYSYTQQYALIRDSAGNLVNAGAPVWLRTGISECRSVASCAGTADETKTTIVYGSSNLLATSTTVSSGDNTLATSTAQSYDSVGNVLTVDGPLPGSTDTTRTRYDALRRVIGIVEPDPDGGGPLLHRATRNTYDASGQLTMVERGTVTGQSDAEWAAFRSLQRVVSVYDVMGRKLRETTFGNGVVEAVTQFGYDASGRLECTATRMDPAQWNFQTDACSPQLGGPFGPDRISRNFYNAAGELTKVQVATGTDVQADDRTSTYTNNGQLSTLTDGEGNKTTYTYDGHDRLQRTSFPDKLTRGVSSTSDYEQLTYDANGNTTQRRLRDGQLIGFSYDNLNRVTLKDLPSPEMDVTYSYDLQGHPLLSVQGASTVSLTWDALGRNRSETSAHGTVSYLYDQAGRRTRTTWPDSFYVTHDFLVTGEVSAIREYGSTLLASFSYDVLGRRSRLSRGNGTTTSYGYDRISRLATLSHDLSAAAHDVASSFGYNPASQITVWSRSNNAYAWTGHFNRNRTYGVNGLNQLTGDGTASFGYDGRGNLTSQAAGTYNYTAENRLISGPSSSTFSYDAIGRLVQSSGSLGTTRFQYDGTDLVAEYNGANQLLRRYVHGPGADEPMVWYEGAGTSDRRWLHQDERGSTVAVSNAAGAVLAVNAYDEYGVPAASNLGRFQYTGQTWLPELGLYYYKARVYSPSLGRFLQTDPIGYGDDVNLYAYVKNDPLNKADPSGEFGVVGFIIGAGIDIGIQTLVQGRSLSEVDYGDVLVAGAVSAVIPGVANAAKVGYNSTKVVIQSTKAISKLSAQSANTANRAQKLDQRIGKNLDKIQGAVAEAGKAAAVAGVHQAVKAAGKEAVPPITADASRDSSVSSSPNPSSTSAVGTPEPKPLPRQPLPCGSPNTSGCGK